MKLEELSPIHKKLVNAIIETPKGSRNKFDYDFALDLFKLKKALPTGMVFPLDFGFIPNTLAEDGDPLDIMVFMDQQSFPGCLVECRVIGVIEATQTEHEGKKIRNDRIIGVADASILYADLADVKDLNKKMTEELEAFFIFYNEREDKKFKPENWGNAKDAIKAIEKFTIKK